MCYHTAPVGPGRDRDFLARIREDLMSRSCAVCGKISMDGFNAQSSGMNRVRAHRRFQPNLQQTTIQVDGKSVKALICTRCQRTISRAAQ